MIQLLMLNPGIIKLYFNFQKKRSSAYHNTTGQNGDIVLMSYKFYQHRIYRVLIKTHTLKEIIDEHSLNNLNALR